MVPPNANLRMILVYYNLGFIFVVCVIIPNNKIVLIKGVVDAWKRSDIA